MDVSVRQEHEQPHQKLSSSSLEINNSTQINSHQNKSNKMHSKKYLLLLVINYTFLFVGSISSSLLSKFYFIHKGSSRWVSTWVQTAAFPLLLIPIYLPNLLKSTGNRPPFTGFTKKILSLSILIGFLLGINNLLFSWGNSYLPVSTSSLLLSTQLLFTLVLSVLIVKQRITFLNLNCVILLTLSSVLLALGSNNDKPQGLTHAKYLIGFFSTIGAGLLFSLYLPLMEKIYRSVDCYEMVMEMQFVMELTATVFATVGMGLDGGFSQMKRESMEVFDKGPAVYWVTVLSNMVTWQLCFMGTAGMVFLTSSLTGGICMAALLTANVLGGVVVYGDEFGGVKIVSTVLCAWGYGSYLFGMYLKMKKDRANENGDNDQEMEIIMSSIMHE